MEQHIPPQPPKSYRVVLDLVKSEKRLDNILLNALRTQKDNLNLKILTRGAFKKLFQDISSMELEEIGEELETNQNYYFLLSSLSS